MSLTAASSIVRALSALTIAAAAYLSFLLLRFFLPPHIERFRLESLFMIFVAASLFLVLAKPGAPRRGLTPARPVGWRLAVSVTAAFLAAAALLYGSALSVGLLSDDWVIADLTARGEWIYRSDVAFGRLVLPAVWSLLLTTPAPAFCLHLANVGLHALNGVLLVLLASRWRMPREQAVAAGTLFVLCPGLTEAVVWTSGMHDVLMATFVLAALLCVLRSEEHPAWIAGATLATALAIGTKETGVVAPVLGWGLWWASTPRPRGRRPIAALSATTLVAIVFALYRLSVGVPDGFAREVTRYFLKQLLVDPLAALGAPWSVTWAREHPLVGFERACLIVALIAVAAFTWRRTAPAFRRAVASAAWVVVAILPVYSLFHVAGNLEGSRYVYLSAAGYALLLAVLAGAAARAVPGYLSVPTLGTIVVALAVPSAAAIPEELARWQAAARARDAMLVEARSHPAIAACASFIATEKADNIDGAFVFRNGLLQALQRDPEAAGPPCIVSWSDKGLTVSPAEGSR